MKENNSMRNYQRMEIAKLKKENDRLRDKLDSVKKNLIEEVEGWKCGCGEIHETEDEAMECQGIEEITAYMCKSCNKLYEEENDAMSCCSN